MSRTKEEILADIERQYEIRRQVEKEFELKRMNRPEDCYCDEEVGDSGYSYDDEYGECDICLEQEKV